MNKDILDGLEGAPSRMKAEGCCGCHTSKLNIFDYLSDLPHESTGNEFVEVQFKNTRKGYYLNSLHLDLHKGDMVAVESVPGHDIGQVTLVGRLVERQMKKCRYRHPNDEPRRVYRLAKPSDMEKYYEVKSLEDDTMIRSRKIAEDLGLEMKIGDVEYQGDGQKAIFYYIAEGRVDFRQLIKKLAEVFRIRVEMKQIGVRQEAGRIGGIGPCGRQLCCSGWMTNFISVGTHAARLQDLSLNPYKLAGQCGKLKCCLNYEVDAYFEAQKKVPGKSIELKTKEGTYAYFKNDTLLGTVSYMLCTNNKGRESIEPVTITNARAWEIIELNRKGEMPDSLLQDELLLGVAQTKDEARLDILAQESVERFDHKRTKRAQRRRANRQKGANEPTKEGSSDKAEIALQAVQSGQRRRRGNRRKDADAAPRENVQSRSVEGKSAANSEQSSQRNRPRMHSRRRNKGRAGEAKEQKD